MSITSEEVFNKSRKLSQSECAPKMRSVSPVEFTYTDRAPPYGTSRGLFPTESADVAISTLTDEIEIEEFKDHVSSETFKILQAMKVIHDRKLIALARNVYALQRQMEKVQADCAKALGTSKFCYAFCKGMEDAGVYKLPSTSY